jgi:hypothetical protein
MDDESLNNVCTSVELLPPGESPIAVSSSSSSSSNNNNKEGGTYDYRNNFDVTKHHII